jgi:hypothetical protein
MIHLTARFRTERLMGFNGIAKLRENQICAESGPCARRANSAKGTFMRMQTSCLMLIAVLLAGCWQKSVHPFYTASDVIAEPKLAGKWTEDKDSEDKMVWTFTPAGEKRFNVTAQNKDEKYEFEGHVFRLGNDRFLDLEGKARGVSTIPAHHLFRIVELGNELKLRGLNTDWVEKFLKTNSNALAHIRVSDPEHRDDRNKDELVITADTKALQKLVREHMNEEDFFAGDSVLKK